MGAGGGEWATIDTTLAAAPDGGSLSPVAAAADITLSNGATDPVGAASPVVATVAVAGDAASLAGGAAAVANAANASGAPADDSAGKGAVSLSVGWDGNLPRPSLAGNQATYSQVAPGVDLRVAALPRGVETYVDLATRPDPVPEGGVVVALPLSAKGLTVVEDGSGGLLVKDASGAVVADTPPALVWDAARDLRSGDPAHQISLPTVLSKTSTGYDLAVTVPAAFLADESTVFPVTVDPVATLFASADTYLASATSTTNYGTDTGLRVGTYDAGGHVARSLLAFPSSSFAGTKVTSAKLHLYQYYSSTCSGTTVNMKSPNGPWSQSGVTWANQPLFASTVDGSINTALGFSSSCPSNWMNGTTGVDVTSLVDGWAAGTITNNGIALAAANETDSNSWRSIYSSEWSNGSVRPSLTVTFNSVPDEPTTWAVSNSGTYSSGGTVLTYVRSARPTLSAPVVDPDGGSLHAVFDVLEGATVIQSHLVGTTVTSGEWSSFALSSAALVEGHSYTFRAYAEDADSISAAATTGRNWTVDTIAPPAPSLSSGSYPANGSWNGQAGQAGVFTFTPANSDTGFYCSALDGPAPTSCTTTTSTTSFPVSPPTAGPHTLYVRTMDKAGNASPDTAWAFNVGSVPDAPTALQANPDSGGVYVSWAAPDDHGLSISSYRVTASPGGATAVAAPVGYEAAPTSIRFPGLNNGSQYSFTVSALNAAGRGPESTPSASAVPATTPGYPTRVAAAANAPGEVTISWEPPPGSAAVDGYTVTTFPGGGTASATVGQRSLTLSTLTVGASYTFKVSASNSYGAGPDSPLSNSVVPYSGVTVPGPPENATAVVSGTSAYIDWYPPSSDGGSPIASYTVVASPGGASSTVGPTSTSTTVAGLAQGTTYSFSLYATSSAGAGPTTTAASLPGVPPSAPLQVSSSTTAAGTSVAVEWTAPASASNHLPNSLSGYEVRLIQSGTVVQTTVVGADATTSSFQGLAAGTNYVAEVAASNRFGTGPATQATPIVVGQPEPLFLISSIALDQAVQVSWQAPAVQPSSIAVTATPAAGGQAVNLEVDGSNTTVTLSGLTNGMPYAIALAATNSYGSTVTQAEGLVTPVATANSVATEGDAADVFLGDSSATVASPVPVALSTTPAFTRQTLPPDSLNAPTSVSVVASAAAGQSALTGIAVDPNGNAVANATVTLTASAGGVSGSTQSDSYGAFAFTGIPAATGGTAYNLSVSAAGYGTYSLAGDQYLSGTAYELTAPLTGITQAYNTAATSYLSLNSQQLSGTATTSYASSTYIPPVVRVGMEPVDGLCASSGSVYKVVKYPWAYYILHVLAREIDDRWSRQPFTANAAAASGFAWYKVQHPRTSTYDVRNSTADQCFDPNRKIPLSDWYTWVQDALKNRIVTSTGLIANTQYRAGQYSCNEAGYPADGNRLSQQGSRALADNCNYTSWSAIDNYYYTASVRPGLKPPSPSTSYSKPGGAILLSFPARVGTSDVGWSYFVDATFTVEDAGGVPRTAWKRIYSGAFNMTTHTLPTNYRYATSACHQYRALANNPVGSSAWATFGQGASICP